jgi:enoyl-CoA hydratase/carnithine racemase
MGGCLVTDAKLILTERRGDGIGIIRLNTPPLNLQTLVSMGQLEAAVRDLASDDDVRVVILTGSGGRVFCAGSDIKEFPALKYDIIEGKLRRENAVFTRIEQMDKPVIAAIDGAALGGGAELCISCDLRVLDEGASIGFPEINLGNFPGSGAIFRLPRLVGQSAARELMMLGTVLTADKAKEIGLVDHIAARGRSLETALSLAGKMAQYPAERALLIKQVRGQTRTAAPGEAVETVLRYIDSALK